MCGFSVNFGSLKLLEPPEPVQTCKGIALLLVGIFYEVTLW
jgi:hypothetical protein